MDPTVVACSMAVPKAKSQNTFASSKKARFSGPGQLAECIGQQKARMGREMAPPVPGA
jgi:hypothetical protein